MSQKKIAPVIKDRLPRFIAEDYPNFVNFLDAYNRFLENDRIIGITLEDFVSITDSVTVLDTDMNERQLTSDVAAFVFYKVLSDFVASEEFFSLEPGKGLNENQEFTDSIVSREIGMLFSEGPYLVNIPDYVDPSYILVSPLVTDEFSITEITRGVIDTVFSSDTAYKTPIKSLLDASVPTDTIQPFSIALGKSDSSTLVELYSSSLAKPVADSSSTTDVPSKSLSTSKTEIIVPPTDTITSVEFSGNKTESQTTADAITNKDIYPLYQETALSSENVYVETSSPETEIANAAEAIQNIGISKLLQDIFASTDLISLGLAPVYFDAVSATESISITLGATLLETGDYMISMTDYVPEAYFGGSIDEQFLVE